MARNHLPKCCKMQCRKQHAKARRKAAVMIELCEDNGNGEMMSMPFADKIRCTIVPASSFAEVNISFVAKLSRALALIVITSELAQSTMNEEQE